jgi:hypothetical protein
MGERLAKGSKRFFFEKKNQKLLSIVPLGQTPAKAASCRSQNVCFCCRFQEVRNWLDRGEDRRPLFVL